MNVNIFVSQIELGVTFVQSVLWLGQISPTPDMRCEITNLRIKGNDHLIEFHLTFSVDRKFLIIWAFDLINFWRLIKIFNNESFIFYHLIELFETFQLIKSFINVILRYFKLSINWQKRTDRFWQLIESSNNGILSF